MTAFEEILWTIRSYEKPQKPVLIAIDGRCSAGKTTLAKKLNQETGCTVIHMDDFFLRPQQRTPERYRKPGGNVDYERFLAEVMKPLMAQQPFSYRPYDCKRQAFAEPVPVQPREVTIIEGAYSCHPAFWDFYDLRIFLNIEKEEQKRRIILRNGEDAFTAFREKWIPLEEFYFQSYDIENRCDLRFQM